MKTKLPQVINVLFRRVSIERLLSSDEKKKLCYNKLPISYLTDLMLTYYPQYSDTEIRLQIREVQEEMESYKKEKSYVDFTLNPFDILFYYVEEILTFHDNEVVCQYQELLEWNELKRAIGEDLAVTSFLVKRNFEYNRKHDYFAWSTIIGHNNRRLEKILEKGIAENHFHLRGSFPQFSISWINLMNQPTNIKYVSYLDAIEENLRDKNKKSESGIRKKTMRELVYCAALIRFYLCTCLNSYDFSFHTMTLGDTETKRDGKDENKEDVECLIKKILSGFGRIEVFIEDIQHQINGIMCRLSPDQDYMNAFVTYNSNENDREYKVLQGERWFLYNVLEKIISGDYSFSREACNWFYVYLRIKNEIRNELVQVNQLVGFQNFQSYQNRKDWFTHSDAWKTSEGRLARLAVRSVLNNQAVKSLEVRITPGETAEINKENIVGYDDFITGDYYSDKQFQNSIYEIIHKECISIKEKRELLNRYYYVWQFPKEADDSLNSFVHMQCRHFGYRHKLQKKAKAIIEFRERYPEQGKRVLGIDACSQEIGCRPEVFGNVYRTLKMYTIPRDYLKKDLVLPQLKLTYHVGEDFLDVADGLRAVDEAIRFLNLGCGDRLGHVLVLGIDVKKWYMRKGNRVTLTIQDYLDNIVWLYHALIKYNVSGMESLKGKLKEDFGLYYPYIYKSHMEFPQSLPWISGTQSQGYQDISIYYYSWLLRGDDPSLYKTGDYVRSHLERVDDWELHAVNRKHLRKQDIRKIREVTLLYYMYHYDKDVRRKGLEIRSFSISNDYMNGVIEVQKHMQEELVVRGIAVETNPSSNYYIGTFKDFSEHPIKTFYNLGLIKNEKELMECPQINVSINTDDQGIFSTNLENEYALLACALEKECFPDGSKKYKKEFIYEWLDRIREMGIQQAFCDK